MTLIFTHNIIPFKTKRHGRYKKTKPLINNQYKKSIEKKAALLAEQHIRAQQTSLVQSCFDDAIFNYDDITNPYIYYDLNDRELSGDELTDAMKDPHFDLNTYTVDIEIKGWYLVTDWLAYKLYEKGETILENDHGNWWGLGHSGSDWSCNHILQKIAKELC